MVPSSRNPVWGEEFDFYAEDLPVQVNFCGHPFVSLSDNYTESYYFVQLYH